MSESSKEHIEQSPTAKPVPPATPSTPVPPATSSITSAPLARRPLIAAEIAKRKESEQQRKLRGSARAKAKKKQKEEVTEFEEGDYRDQMSSKSYIRSHINELKIHSTCIFLV